ncbi:MAG: hypothetical protein ACLGIN_18270, partial [Candidatus Sericytochromatia bacterium]
PTPLEAVLGYRLQAIGSAGGPGVSVLGVAPPVSGRSGQGQSFMLRPSTHEVMRVDDQGGIATWGGLGAEPGRLNSPGSLAVTKDRVYVADTGNHRIQVFDPQGRLVGGWGTFGNGPGQLNHPRSIEVMPGGNLAVVDDMRVHYFGPDGAIVGEVPFAVPTRLAPVALLGDAQEVVALTALMGQFQHLAAEQQATAQAEQRAALIRAAREIREDADRRLHAAIYEALLRDAIQRSRGLLSVGTPGVMMPKLGGMSGSAGPVMRAPGDGLAPMPKLAEEAGSRDVAVEQADAIMQDMMDLIREIREKLQAIEQANAETNRGIARDI